MRYRRPLTLLLLDVDFDFFKPEHNVRWGLAYAVYKQLGPLLLKRLRTVDMAGRIGGDTFAVMLPETGLSGAFIAGDRLLKAVEAHQFLGETPETIVRVALSVGVATFPDHGTSGSELLASAQKALQLARRDGSNQTVVYPDRLHEAAEVFRARMPFNKPASDAPTDADAPQASPEPTPE